MQRRQRSAYGRRPSVPAAHVETQPKWVESIEALLRGLGDRLVELWAHTINFLSIVLWVGGETQQQNACHKVLWLKTGIGGTLSLLI